MPEATYCALASRSCPGLSGTSRVGDAGPAGVEDSPRLQDPPDPGSRPLLPPTRTPGHRGRRRWGPRAKPRRALPGLLIPPKPALSGLSFPSGQTGANFPAPPSDPARHPSDPRGAGTCGRGEVGWEVEARGPQRRKENQPPRNSYLSTPRAPRSSPRPWPSRCGECCRSNSDLRPPPSPDSLNFLEADAARKREKV